MTERAARQPNPISKYFRETRGELKKVTWPTRQESWRLTLIVIAVTIVFAIFLAFFDFVFSNTFEFIINQVIGF